MNFDRRSRVPSSRLWQATTCLLVAVQVLLAFAPLLERRFGADARAHVETTGTSVHHVHNAADCAACAARALLATADRTDNPLIGSHRGTILVAQMRDDSLAEFLKGSNSRPRAPPFRQA
jgi:hypothetical protein